MDQKLRTRLFDAMVCVAPKPGEPVAEIHVEFAEMTSRDIDRIAPIIDEIISDRNALLAACKALMNWDGTMDDGGAEAQAQAFAAISKIEERIKRNV